MFYLEMGKVVPVPGLNFFLTRTSTKIFSEQDRAQNVFLDPDRDQNIFDWDRHQNLFLKGPGPRPKTFSRRDRDQIFFFAGTGTGTKNDWSRSCLVLPVNCILDCLRKFIGKLCLYLVFVKNNVSLLKQAFFGNVSPENPSGWTPANSKNF
jgi:hypothetical protein